MVSDFFKRYYKKENLFNVIRKNDMSSKKVFISYARKDKKLVQSFLSSEVNRDFTYWIDEGDKKPGSNWRNTIRTNINNSDGAILFITPNALKSETIRDEEIPYLIKRNNDPDDNFHFFPVFLDYVDKQLVEKYTFKNLVTKKTERLFDIYDIWNIEANDESDLEHEMPSEMSEFKKEKFWEDLNLNVSKALSGKKVSKIDSSEIWNANKTKSRLLKKERNKRNLTYALVGLLFASLFYLVLRPQDSEQTSEVFNIGGSVQLGALTTGDCFNLIDASSELNWNTYVSYRACDLLHDGEVFFRENQIDFGDNLVSYTSLLNLFTQTCNDEFEIYSKSAILSENFDINFYWDNDSQLIGSKPFDMLCTTLYQEKNAGSFVEDITGISITLPNPGDKYDCEDFDTVEDAQIWFELYFQDYGDVALLDFNNNGKACDEIKSSESSDSTSIGTSSTTTSTTVAPTTTIVVSKPPQGQTSTLEGVTELIKVNQDMIDWGGNWLNGDYLTSINNYLNNGNLQIVNFWNGKIEVKLPTPVLIAGPWTSKVVLNGEQLGVKSPFGTSYSYDVHLHIGNLKERQNYKLEVYIVDAVLREHGPMVLEFNGSDWNNDDSYCCRNNFEPSDSGKYVYDFDNEFLSKPVITSFETSAKKVDNENFELLIDIEYKPEPGLTGFSIGYIGIVDNEVVLFGAGTSPVRTNHRLSLSKYLNKNITLYVYHQMTKWADPIFITVTEDWFNN